MRLLAQFVAVLLLVGFVGAYFWWIVTAAAVASVGVAGRSRISGRAGCVRGRCRSRGCRRPRSSVRNARCSALFTTRGVRGMMVEPSEVTDMDLYLMQHGQATTETEDPERPLTDAGRAAVQRVAKRARAADVRISGCLHSGKLRAEQTAQLLVREIGAEPSVEARPGLAPNDPVVVVAQWLRAETEHPSLALVGHMPFLDRLASLLVVGDEQAQVVRFQMGGLVKLEPKVDRDGFSVAWALPPDLA